MDCGGPNSTPNISTVSSSWPEPWFCWRILVVGGLVTFGFLYGFVRFKNYNMFPGLMITGAFFVPLACVVFVYEHNAPRNISPYRVITYIIIGGILSLLISLYFFDLTPTLSYFLGATSAGLVEEAGKILTVLLLLRPTRHPWIHNGLLIGAAVGAGFAGFESAGYIFRFAFAMEMADIRIGLEVLVRRALFAPFGHVIWTAAAGGALVLARKGSGSYAMSLFKWQFIRVLLFVMILHMFWNSSLLDTTSRYITSRYIFAIGWSLSIVGGWYLVLLLINAGNKQVKLAQSH